MGFFSNTIDRTKLKAGDHIYAWRTGYFFAHHGIYVGDDKVIHFTIGGQELPTETVLDAFVSSMPDGSYVYCPPCIPSKAHGVVSSCLDCFLAGGTLRRFEYSVRRIFKLAKVRATCTLADSDSEEIVVHRAKHLLASGFGCYNVFSHNCEDFAVYCKTGLLAYGQFGQAASIIGAPVGAGLSVMMRLARVTTNVYGMAATTVLSHYVARYAADIRIRKDVIQVPVEELTRRLAEGMLQVVEMVEDDNSSDKDS